MSNVNIQDTKNQIKIQSVIQALNLKKMWKATSNFMPLLQVKIIDFSLDHNKCATFQTLVVHLSIVINYG